jgi:hypothetical protein
MEDVVFLAEEPGMGSALANEGEQRTMGIGTSIFVIAVGALMTFAVNVNNSNGFDINNAGIILMIIGAVGLIASVIIWGPRTRRTVMEDNSGRRATVVQRDEF